MVDTVRLQVSIFSTSYSSVNSIAQSVRDAFDGLTGEVAGCSVDGVYFDDESDMYEDEHNVFHKAQEYIIRVKNDASSNTSDKVISYTSLTSDATLTAAIPAGYLIEYMIFDEKSGNTAQLSAGTTAGDNNIMNQEAITGGALTVVNINKVFSKTTSSTIYLNHAQSGDTWNSSNIDVYIQLRKFT